VYMRQTPSSPGLIVMAAGKASVVMPKEEDQYMKPT
jgi:hypothetical protein